MSRIIKLIDNETIEIVEYSKANACFQTNEYTNDELFCVIREQINPFDMYAENQRLQNVLNQIEGALYNENLSNMDCRITIEEILDKENGDGNNKEKPNSRDTYKKW